jgi:hypothetical protein
LFQALSLPRKWQKRNEEMPTPVGNPKQIDHSTIPPAVRKAAERAEQAMKEQAAAREQQAQPDQSPPFQEPPQPEPERAPEAAAPEPPHAPEPPQPEPERAPEPQPAPAGDEAWEEKYKRQLGHTRRLQQDLQAMSTRVDEMQRLLSTVQAAPPAAAAAPTVEQLLTPEEQEEWKEVLPVMEKRFREMYSPIEHQFRSEIDGLKEQLQLQQKTTVAGARDRMHHTLNTHPVLGLQSDHSWQVLNNDDDFIGWLQYLDPLSGRQRHSMLKEAYALNDAGRMAAIFEAYLRDAGLEPAAPQPNGNGAGSPPPSSNGLERFAAPGPARSAPASTKASAGPQHFTTGDISRFYADRTAGRWKGREKEANAYEAEIFKAQAANRIRPGPPQP